MPPTISLASTRVAAPLTAGAIAALLAATGPAAHATTTLSAAALEAGPFSRVREAMTLADDPLPALQELARRHADTVRLIRPLAGDDGLVVVELGRGSDAVRGSRPALLVVAGLDGRHTVGTMAAVRFAESLVADPELLDRTTVYIVPRIVEPGLPTGRVAIPRDDDHDGRVDEDGPTDLDGDGVIRSMRIAEPSPLLGLSATHVIDPDDPRRMRPAEAGEQPTHAMLPEGTDADGDGRFAEDGVGGIDANADWPAHWPEFADGVAGWALSLPRTRAIADWMLDTESIAAVLVFGPGDSLAAVPTTRGAGPTGRVPEGLLDADERDHTAVSEHFRELTGIKAGDRGPRIPGSLDAWAYSHLGLWSFSTPLWGRPDRIGDLARGPEPEAAAEGADADATPSTEADSTGGNRRGSGRGSSGGDEAAWLAWIDAERDGAGFAPWTMHTHPQLGSIEIGGIDPGLMVNPPADLAPRLAVAGADFARDLLGMLPRLEIADTAIRRVGDDIHEVAVTIHNSGTLPTRPAIAERARRLTPTLIELSVDDAAILAGPTLGRIERLEGGGSTVLRWQIRTSSPEDLQVVVIDPMHGRLTATFPTGEETRR
jgi:hypothetical protein